MDLSDTVNFPHQRVGRIDVSGLSTQIDREASATGAVLVGVITRIDGTDADISYFENVSFRKSDARNILRDQRFSPTQIKCEVSGGEATRFLTDIEEANVAAVNTGVTLDGPGGKNFIPAVGDIVVKFEYSGSGSYNATVQVTYHGENSGGVS